MREMRSMNEGEQIAYREFLSRQFSETANTEAMMASDPDLAGSVEVPPATDEEIIEWRFRGSIPVGMLSRLFARLDVEVARANTAEVRTDELVDLLQHSDRNRSGSILCIDLTLAKYCDKCKSIRAVLNA